MEIKVLGGGCDRCQTLFNHVEEAVQKAGLEVTVSKVTDYDEMLSYGMLRTPGLVVEGKLVMSGRVPSVGEIMGLIADVAAGGDHV